MTEQELGDGPFCFRTEIRMLKQPSRSHSLNNETSI